MINSCIYLLIINYPMRINVNTINKHYSTIFNDFIICKFLQIFFSIAKNHLHSHAISQLFSHICKQR